MTEESNSLVYVVDDESVISNTLAAILRIDGFRAMDFSDPVAALKSAQSQCPSYLISDVQMDGMDGIEFAIRLKSICPMCKVILLAGAAPSVQHLEAATASGLQFKFMIKPVQPSELLAELKQI